jgi:hypothetical protein
MRLREGVEFYSTKKACTGSTGSGSRAVRDRAAAAAASEIAAARRESGKRPSLVAVREVGKR